MTASVSYRTWTEADIAALSASDIAQLNYDEMLELISGAPTTIARFGAAQVTESDILVRHVYALRQRCRNKIAVESHGSEKLYCESNSSLPASMR